MTKNDRLAEYRRRRDAGRTPEPVPDEAPLPHGDDDTFVIQEHHARSLHWDLRLERGGVLVSWAVPKGVPSDPGENRLAVHTEDHPLEYAAFEGEIPAGEYGAGKSLLWDRGTYETEKWTDREVKVVFHGTRVQGRYVLFRTRGDNWMIHRMDPPADPDAVPPPEGLRPMLAQERKRLPKDEDAWAYEFAWGGRRLLARISGGRTRCTDAAGRPAEAPPGVGSALGGTLGVRTALLDGEVARVAGTEVYLIFDLLHLDGRPLLDVPYRERRERLDALGLDGARHRTAPWFPGGDDPGAAVLDAARREGLAAIVAKRLDSPYRPGKASADWRLLPAGQ
ncbi:DNA polymerase ligase N-terminal domain-containing protein [Actinomadura rayongensis]|uniref:ATP-dependent DNA ligase n=1 Tax=Actinomadura rayongensis TaxID=1429076 RepID=A0A6I4W2Z2_9ACTN|nr:ATP-dependent DNA ligase [Actinomadura rayongensis]